MQVEAVKTEGLSREISVTVTAAEIESKVEARLEEMKDQIQLPGFRPGKVPMSMLKKRFGDSLLGEILEATIRETSEKAVNDTGVRPAGQPNVEVTSFDKGQDLIYKVEFEAMPDIQPVDFATLKVSKPTAAVTDEEVQKGLDRIAEQQKTFSPVKRKAKNGDQLIISFTGELDGTADERLSGEDVPLEIGAGQFIPGFEDQLKGSKAEEEKTVEVTFPDDYGAEDLQGKPAKFAVTVKEVKGPSETKIDDEFAKTLGFDDLEALKGIVQGQIEQEFGAASRAKMKRDMLDKLDENHSFDLPPVMVENEYSAIVQQVASQKAAQDEEGQAQGESEGPADKDMSDEDKAEYRSIAERRVKLGLLLSEVARLNTIEVSEEEVQRAMYQEAGKYPGQEQQVLQYLQQNPQAQAQLRAPLFEDKVIDFIAEIASIEETTVTPEELFTPDDDEEEEAA